MRSQEAEPSIQETAGGLTAEELAEEVVFELPDREAMSVAFPLGVAVVPAGALPTAAAKGAPVAETIEDPSALEEG